MPRFRYHGHGPHRVYSSAGFPDVRVGETVRFPAAKARQVLADYGPEAFEPADQAARALLGPPTHRAALTPPVARTLDHDDAGPAAAGVEE